MADHAPPPVFSIVGRSGSGKTTLIEKLIPLLVERGLRVATIKHTVHAIEIDQQGKDTARHRGAGAKGVMIVSAKHLFLVEEPEAPPSFEELTGRFDRRRYDLILTEGFKRGPAPKIELLRGALSVELTCDPASPDLIAVAADRPIEGLPVPLYDLDDAAAIAALILEHLGLANPPVRPPAP